jgi:large subunit ribosomal protein L21
MFAIVRTGGKQYRVAPGDKIVVEKLDGNAGDSVTLSDVLLAGDGSDLKGTDGLTVGAEIVAQAKGEKVTVFKKRRRHNYRRKKGHRQQHTILRIVSIGDQKAAAAPVAGEAPAETAPKPKKAPKQAATADEATSFEGVAPADAGTEAVNDVSTENAAPAKAGAKKNSKAK